MYQSCSQIVGLKVRSIHSGFDVGHVSTLLVDRDKLTAELLEVVGGESREPRYLLASDVRFRHDNQLLIDNEDKLSLRDELVRLGPLIDAHFVLLGCSVRTQSGKTLGGVQDYSVDTTSLKIKQLDVTPGWPARFWQSKLLIERTNIVDTSPKVITVRDNLAPAISKQVLGKRAAPNPLPTRMH